MTAVGTLRHRLSIQSRSETVNASGDEIDTWTSLTTVWGNVREGSGREVIIERSLQNQAPATIVIRYRSDINPEMEIEDVCGGRAGCNGKRYSIIGISDVDGRRRELTITAQTLRQLSGAEL